VTNFKEEYGVLISVDIAIPCGLIVNELATSALKYAFPEERGATGERRGRRKMKFVLSLGYTSVNRY
jgi:two-component sensor histidine kinase